MENEGKNSGQQLSAQMESINQKLHSIEKTNADILGLLSSLIENTKEAYLNIKPVSNIAAADNETPQPAQNTLLNIQEEHNITPLPETKVEPTPEPNEPKPEPATEEKGLEDTPDEESGSNATESPAIENTSTNNDETTNETATESKPIDGEQDVVQA